MWTLSNAPEVPVNNSHGPCACLGAKEGEPACPCVMRNVRVVDGRFIYTKDLGPAPTNSGVPYRVRV